MVAKKLDPDTKVSGAIVVETHRCTGHCCRAFTLGGGMNPIELGRFVTRDNEDPGHPALVAWIREAVVYLGEHERNPAGVATIGDWGELRHWYGCRWLVDGDCSRYSDRPYVCREYPEHGRGEACEYAECTRRTKELANADR